MMINYQMERHKRIIQEKETQLIQSRHKNTVYGASIIVVLVITFTTGLLYIRKARMYRLIALSYYETHHDTKPISTPNQSRQAPSLRETLQKLMSEDLGFNDLSTFYRSFQKIVGMPPSRFRQEILNI